jgi:hypothetical protein
MNTAHLTEAQLQLYADNAEAIDRHLKEHLAHCSNCQIKLENYRLINSALKAMPAPAFDFDLAEQVLASVAVKKTPVAWVPLLAAVVGVLLLALTTGLYVRNIAVWFVALPKVWSYVLTIPVLVFLLVHLILSIVEYQRKMNMLLSK